MSNKPSSTSVLSIAYGSFFAGAGRFALSPYLTTLYGWSGTKKVAKENGTLLGAISDGVSDGISEGVGMVLCVALTIIPVLPACTLVTMTLSLAAAFIAAISALITFPVALIADGIDGCLEDCGSSVLDL